IGLEAARQGVALEVHEKDHVVGGGERLACEIEVREPRETRADDEHVGIDRHDPLEAGGQNLVEKQPAKDGPRKAPARLQAPIQAPIEAGEVDGEEFDAIAQWAREPVEAERDVAGLADKKDLMTRFWFRLDERGDGSDRRREECSVGREAIGGSHPVPPSSASGVTLPAPEARPQGRLLAVAAN